MYKLIKEILATRFVWRLTGIMYVTAVIVTNGEYIPKNRLIEIGKEEMNFLDKYFNNSSDVLEFGCGIGKNLLGIAQQIRTGTGLDVNGGYIRIAKYLARRFTITTYHSGSMTE